MEASKRIQIQVGLFVVAGLITVMVSIFMVGGDRSLLTGRIRLFAQFDQVQGLAEGSVVSLAGINIGNLEKIDFDPATNHVKVTMIIDKSYGPKIKQGSKVEIRTAGALGDKFLYVIPGDTAGASVKDGDTIPVAVASDLFGMLAERSKDTEKIFDIISEIHQITKTLNGDGHLQKIMSNMALASEQLKDASTEAHQFTKGLAETKTQNLGLAVNHLESILTKIDSGQGTLGALINDPAIHDRLKTMLGGSARTQHMKTMLRTSIEKANGE